MSRISNIRKASWIGVFGNTFLSVIKILTGVLTGSLAVVGDGIDSAIDILTSLLTLWVAKIIEKPPDEQHPYGHGRAETIATRILSFIILYAGIQLIITSVQDIITGKAGTIPGLMAIVVTLISIALKLFLAWYKHAIGKQENSSMLIADAKNMRNDVVLSAGVLLGLILTNTLALPMIDKIIAFFLGLWIIKVAIGIFVEENSELMEGVSDTGIYAVLFKSVSDVKGAYNPHRARIRKIGSYLIVDLDIEVAGELTVFEGHEIAKQVENSIKKSIDNVYDVLIHVEPLGNFEENEKYGLSPRKKHKQ